jgi:N-acetylglucosamine kinase-like BadF-type ATPase
VVTGDGSTVTVARGEPTNADVVGRDTAARAFRDCFGEALRQARERDFPEIVCVTGGIAGVDTREDAAVLEGVVGEMMPGTPTVMVNDVVTAWATEHLGGPGMVLIAGTGTNCFGVAANGDSWRSGGWGHVLGDEGSGYRVGLDGLRAAVQDRDGRGPSTPLTRAALDYFTVDSVTMLSKHIYLDAVGKQEIAAFAPHVDQAAREGDGVAEAICKQGAGHLARHLEAVRARIDGEGLPVGLVGSFIRRATFTRNALSAALPGWNFTASDRPAIMGGLILALRLAGREPEDLDAFAAAVASQMAEQVPAEHRSPK